MDKGRDTKVGYKNKKTIDNAWGAAPKSNMDRLYIPRNEGGQELLNVEDVIDLAIIGLERYVCNSTERLLTGYEGDTEDEYKLRKKNKRCQAWKEKTLHGQFLRQRDDEVGNDRLGWLRLRT